MFYNRKPYRVRKLLCRNNHKNNFKYKSTNCRDGYKGESHNSGYIYTIDKTKMRLSTLVVIPWLNHSHNDDDNSDKKDYNGNAHPFPGVPL
jgi:hypothetical protein